MNKHYLLSKMKSTGTTYLYWFFFGCHYAYLRKWGLQLLYWFIPGGLGFWCFMDLFHIPTKVNNHNMIISSQIADIEKNEREGMHSRNIAMIVASQNR